MRIALLMLALAGCMSSEPVREGRARVALGAMQEEPATASYRVVSGSNDSACAHGEHFTPQLGADVRMGPAGGPLVRLVEQQGGAYTATAPAAYAASYQFSVDGELFEVEAPAFFAAKIQAMSTSQAMVELTDASAPSDIVIQAPDGRRTSRTLVGTPALIDADFSAKGEYQVELLRTVESTSGVVELSRQITLVR